jgi:hypothetical protein
MTQSRVGIYRVNTRQFWGANDIKGEQEQTTKKGKSRSISNAKARQVLSLTLCMK